MPRVLPSLAAAVALLGAFSPLLLHPRGSGGFDLDKELLDADAAREAILRFRELPLWNRYCGGGNPLLANPETFCASPFFLLILAFGARVGLRLSIVAHALLGAYGMARLSARCGASREAACLAAALWPLTGTFAMHLAVAHIQWQTGFLVPFLLLPLMDDSRAGTGMASTALALMLVGGGIHVALIGGVGFALLAVACALRDRSPAKIPPAIGVLLAGSLLAGYRLAPALTLLATEPHRVASHAGYTPGLLAHALLAPTQAVDDDATGVDRAEGGGYWEYGAYVGLLALPLAAAGLHGLRRDLGRAAIGHPAAILVAAGVLLALELPSPLSPWRWLHSLPPFASERRPSRFILLLALGFVLCCARGLDAVRARRPRLAAALAFLAVVDTGLASRGLLARSVQMAPAPTSPRREAFRLVAEGSTHGNFEAGLGTTPCRQGLHVPQRAIPSTDPRYRGEAWLEGEGVAMLAAATARTFRVSYAAPRGGTVVINQNHFVGWRAWPRSASLTSHEGLVAAEVPPGSGEVTFLVSSDSAIFGLVLTAFGAGFTGFLMARPGRRRDALP